MTTKGLTPEEKKEFRMLNKFPGELGQSSYERLRELRGKIIAATQKKPRSGAPTLKKSPLRKVSKKHAAELRVYTKLRREFLMENPVCQFPGCAAEATDVHHAEGRGAQTTNKVDSFFALCRPHHDYCHEHPKEARKLGLLH